MKNIRRIILTIMVVLVAFGTIGVSYGDPLPTSEQNALNEWPLWVPDSSLCSDLNGPAGSGPIYGLDFPKVADVGALATSINNYITNTRPDSPLKGFGQDFVQSGVKYNVNPAMIVGFAEKESGLGVNTVPGSYDAFGLTANGDIPGAPYANGITDFPSWEGSIDPEFNYVSTNYVHGGFNSQTIYDLMKHYTPDDPGPQTAITLDVMHKILDGLATTVTGATDSGSGTTSNGCINDVTQSSFTPGQNGYDLTGTNAMAHFYQCDTLDGSAAAPWANDTYGAAGTVCSGGCGITSATMVVDTLDGVNETPGTLAAKYGSRFASADGTEWSLWSQLATDYHLTYKDLGLDFDAVDNIIHQGGLVIVSVGPGYFTSGGHLMVIRAVDNNGNFYLADPNGPRPADHQTETKGFSAGFMINAGNTEGLFAFTKA